MLTFVGIFWQLLIEELTVWKILFNRFDSKRFCRDCRRNVIREFKELKELKRMRREPRCTSWFCVADYAFQCEVRVTPQCSPCIKLSGIWFRIPMKLIWFLLFAGI